MSRATLHDNMTALRPAADDASTHAYLNILQGVISRMAGNSANCKTWCITIVSAILVVAIDKNKPGIALGGLLPVALFFLLDVFYLSLERDFKILYNSFVDGLHAGGELSAKLYVMKRPKGFKHFIGVAFPCTFSLSIWPFYGVLAAGLWIASRRL